MTYDHTIARLARMPPEQARMVLALAAVAAKHRKDADAARPGWRDRARPEQVPPGVWRTWYIRGGRGSGKTWTGSHALVEMAEAEPGEYAVVCPTYADARDTAIEGPSGILAALGTNRSEVDRGASRRVTSWNRSMGDLRMRNGSVVWADGADDGALRIQGKNLRGAWCDEVGLWKLTSWERSWRESVRFAVRLAPARIVATGTPKRGHPLVRELMKDASVHKTLMLTSDNAANIDPETLAEWTRLYGGTTLGRQELLGEMLDDVPGALWVRGMIEASRVPAVPAALTRIVVAIDPSATSTESADECGMVVAGAWNGHGYVLEDLSVRASPQLWAERAVAAYRRHKADRIIAETNNGGEMVGQIIRSIDPSVPYSAVTASRGKQTRAEPVAALYEQGRVHHVGTHELLEDQMCQWVPGDRSPDRMDALVWSMTELLVQSDNPWASLRSAGGVA